MEIIYTIIDNEVPDENTEIVLESPTQLGEVIDKIDELDNDEDGQFQHVVTAIDGDDEYVLAIGATDEFPG